MKKVKLSGSELKKVGTARMGFVAVVLILVLGVLNVPVWLVHVMGVTAVILLFKNFYQVLQLEKKERVDEMLRLAK